MYGSVFIFLQLTYTLRSNQWGKSGKTNVRNQLLKRIKLNDKKEFTWDWLKVFNEIVTLNRRLLGVCEMIQWILSSFAFTNKPRNSKYSQRWWIQLNANRKAFAIYNLNCQKYSPLFVCCCCFSYACMWKYSSLRMLAEMRFKYFTLNGISCIDIDNDRKQCFAWKPFPSIEQQQNMFEKHSGQFEFDLCNTIVNLNKLHVSE